MNEKTIFNYGKNRYTNEDILFNRVNNLQSPQGLIIGTPGSGKSTFICNEIQQILNNTEDDVILIDPFNDYQYVLDDTAANIISLDITNPNRINPFDFIGKNISLPIMEDDNYYLSLQYQYVRTFFEIILGRPLNSTQKAILDILTRHLYKSILYDDTKLNYVITITDYYNELISMKSVDDAVNMALAIELYEKGFSSFFNEKTNVVPKTRFTIYETSKLTGNLKELSFLSILNQIWLKVEENYKLNKRTWVYIDCMDIMIYSYSFISNLFIMARPHNCVFTGVLTNGINDFYQDESSKRIINNCGFVTLLNSSIIDRQILKDCYQLSKSELDCITNVSTREGLLILGDKKIPFHFNKNN